MYFIITAVGGMLAWASSVSVAVDRNAPVIAMVAMHCIFVIWRSTATDPLFLFMPKSLWGGVYHVSRAYVILGTPTDRYSCRMSLSWTPVEGLVILLNSITHFVAFSMACIV